MEQINKEELEQAQRRIMEMSSRSRRSAPPHKMPPAPDFVRPLSGKPAPAPPAPEKKPQPPERSAEEASLFSLINFKNILGDPERLLLAGIMLLLGGEKADQKLILALLYIML